MKLLVLLLLAIGAALLVLPMLTVAVIATHPWLAVGALSGSVTVRAPQSSAAVMPAPVTGLSEPPATDAAAALLAAARDWLGVPYLFGGCSRRGVDCSCYVQIVYRAFGMNLPRVAQAQYNATARVGRDELVPGDLVFFENTYASSDRITHVGIYAGGGMMVQAGGAMVSAAPVFSGFYGAHYAGAGRVR